MTKFERITAALEALPDGRKEEIAEIIETLFHGDLHPESTQLTDEQIADLRERMANPGPIASDEEVEAFFRRFA
jgi:5-methylthioribose kinase